MVQEFIFPKRASRQLKTVQDYFKYLCEWDFDRLERLSTENFTQSTLPASLGVPQRTKIVDLGFLKDMSAGLSGEPLELTIYDVDDGPGKVWVHMRMDSLNVECIFCFQFGEGVHSHKIVSLKEFVDSEAFEQLSAAQPAPAA